jgi:hypothetical protein
MAKMTEEEADALDELLTRTTPSTNPNVKGVFARQRELLSVLDELSAQYLWTRAAAENTSPAAIIGDLVREKVFVAV